MSTISRLKSSLEKRFPEAIAALRQRWYIYALRQMARTIAAGRGLEVQSGPFQGLRYTPHMLASEQLLYRSVLPKIVGSYEAELHGALRQVFTRPYQRIVNIGCSDGYYAVGLLLRLPGAHSFAFDLDPHARELCAGTARLNGVADRLTIEGQCTPERLQSLAARGTLVVCDCEGCELALLRPDLTPGLAACDLIVELHDWFDPSISQAVPARFAGTHEVTIFTATDRDASAYPVLGQFGPHRRRLALEEGRCGAPQAWAFLVSRDGG